MDADDLKHENVREMRDWPPTVRYANMMLLLMAKRGVFPAKLRLSGALPPFSECPGIDYDAEEFASVDYPHVINRLKVMCQLNAVSYKEPVEGKFELVIGNVGTFQVHCSFDDRCSPPSCELLMDKLEEDSDA